MDSNQEAANLAQIENTRLSRQMVKITWASLIFGAVSATCAIIAVWPSSAGGGSMTNWIWIPAIILGTGSLATATALIIMSFKQWRYKKLAKTTAQLQSNLNKTQSELELERGKPKFIMDVGAVETQNLKIAQLETANRALGDENTKAQQQLEAAKEAANQIQAGNNILEDKLHASEDEVQRLNIALSLANIRENKLEQELSSAKELKDTADRSIEMSRQEVRELAAKLDTQLEQAAQYDRGLREQTEYVDSLRVMLGEARQEAEQATARANQETNQRQGFIELYHEADLQLATWKPIIEHAKAQAAQIDEWVRMKTAIPGKILHRKRIVTFGIRIHNNSLFPISIRPKDITGSLHFKAERFKEEVDPLPNEPAIMDLEPGGTDIIKLQQPLRIFEAEKVHESHELADSDALFWLGDLYIPISAKNTPVPVRALPLVIIPEHISLDMHSFSYHE